MIAVQSRYPAPPLIPCILMEAYIYCYQSEVSYVCTKATLSMKDRI